MVDGGIDQNVLNPKRVHVIIRAIWSVCKCCGKHVRFNVMQTYVSEGEPSVFEQHMRCGGYSVPCPRAAAAAYVPIILMTCTLYTVIVLLAS